MKNYLIALATLFLLPACGDDPQPVDTGFKTVGKISEITISDIGNSYSWYHEITEIAFVARIHAHNNAYRPIPNPGEEDPRIMLRVPFDERGTKLVLPEPPQELLTDITRDFPNASSISDAEAKTVYFVEIACDVSDTGNYRNVLLQYLTTNDAAYRVKYVYSDRAVSITGVGADSWGSPTTFDLHLVKGWNQIVEKSDFNTHMQYVTHSMPENIKWERDAWS